MTTATRAAVSMPPMSAIGSASHPRSRSQCSPFAVRRESGSVSSLIGRASINSSGAGPTTTVVGSRCGSHTTQARSAGRLGSAAKSQPPSMRYPFGHFGDCMSCAGDRLVGGLVGAIASQKLPGERGSAKIVEIGAGVGIPPIALVWHLSSPLSDYFPIRSYYRKSGSVTSLSERHPGLA
jgi:hypothetical protein